MPEIRTIVQYPHAALSEPTKPVDAFDASLHELLDDLAATMYHAEGVGLAASQIAVMKRVAVIDIGAREEGHALIELVNPKVVESEGTLIWQEGCLSFPDLLVDVKRAARVVVEYQDRHGAQQRIEGDDLLGVALQHEIDHLDGVVFIDRVSRLDKRLALRRFQRILERRREEAS